MNKEAEAIFRKSMDDYIRYFLMNRSYIQMNQIQDSRSNIRIYDVTEDQMFDKRFLKHKCFVDTFKSVYVTLPYDYLTSGERINFKDIRRIRYELQTLDVINGLFGNTIDIFYNGVKVLRKEILIALYDDFFVIQLPKKYKDFTKMSVMMRPYIMDISVTTSSVKVEKQLLNNTGYEDFIVYVNGKQTKSYSVLNESTTFTIRASIPVTTMEVTYIRNINEYGQASLKNSHLDLRSVRGKYPIPPNNILTFSNGLFVNLNVTPKTGNIFESAVNTSDKFLVYYAYKEYSDEEYYYDDKYAWFADYKSNIMDIINNPNELPRFINEFYLYTREISLSDFLEKGYSDLLVYNTDIAKDTIAYDDELITKIYECIYNNMDTFNLFTRKYVDMSKEDRNSMIRNDNTQEDTDPSRRVDFISPMYVFKVPNINKYNINVYVDGIRYFDYKHVDRVGDVDNIYLKVTRVPNNAIIEFEYVNTPHNNGRFSMFVGTGSTKITISNASKDGLISGVHELRYISISTSAGANVALKDIEYDASADQLIITGTKAFGTGSTFRITNTFFNAVITRDTGWRSNGKEDFSVPISSLNIDNLSVEYFRVFKNGRELPRSCYRLSTDKTKMIVNAEFTIYEQIVVEYLPNKQAEIYYNPKLGSDGRVDMLTGRPNTEDYLIDIDQYFILNGRKVPEKNYKIWCTKGMTLSGLKSQKHFCIRVNEDELMKELMYEFVQKYKVHTHAYSEYIITIMKGSLTDTEDDCTDKNLDRMGELYYDLYQEFLKHNIVDLSQPLPEYIAFKYAPLIDENLNNTIMLDTTEQQLYWMPLDATMQHEDDLIEIMGLWYKLLEDVHSIQAVDPNDIPDELYEKYKELFDNNVLVVQMPNFAVK